MPDHIPAVPPDPGAATQPAPARPQRYLFLLLDRFTMISFAAAIEPLRLANRLAGRVLYEWRLLGEGGAYATCSNGARLVLDGDLPESQRGDTILVCGGVDVARAASRPVLGWLRREARRGARMGALCTGAWVLAEAGLLDGRRATIHWENQDGFAEEFPDVTLIRTVFVEDGNRLTAAGGTAAIDLMLRQLKLTNIHREHLGDFEDVFIIAKGPAGDETDRFLGEAIDRLAASGKLAEIYSRLHRPYVEWQPQPLPAADGNKTP